jgi:hypothetical protein
MRGENATSSQFLTWKRRRGTSKIESVRMIVTALTKIHRCCNLNSNFRVFTAAARDKERHLVFPIRSQADAEGLCNPPSLLGSV